MGLVWLSCGTNGSKWRTTWREAIKGMLGQEFPDCIVDDLRVPELQVACMQCLNEMLMT